MSARPFRAERLGDLRELAPALDGLCLAVELVHPEGVRRERGLGRA